MERCKFSKKIFPMVWSKYLSSWTGPDMSKSQLFRSGHDQITTFQVRTWPNQDFSGPDMSRSRFFRSGHVQIRTFQVRTWPNQDFWWNFECFGFKIRFLTKFHNDSASFLPEKLKNQVILTKNLNIWPKIPKIPQKSRKIFLHNIDQGGRFFWPSKKT